MRVRELVEALGQERRDAEDQLREVRSQLRALQADLGAKSAEIREVLYMNQGGGREAMMSKYARTRGWRLYKTGGRRRKIEPAYFLARDFIDLDEIELWLDARGE